MGMTKEQEAEIRAARALRRETLRPTVAALEEILFEPLPVLDHGFVRVIDYMGDDAAIVQAARVSYGKGTKKVHEDRGLIRYLMRHRHTTPFEMCEIKLHCKLPIFVARQWIRHRTACLTGDVRLVFDLPARLARGGRQAFSVPIERFHRLWHRGLAISPRKRKPLFLDRVDPATHYTVPALGRLVERREEDLRNMVRSGRLEAERRGNRIFIPGSAWHAWARSQSVNRIPMQPRLARMHLRMCDEDTGEIRHTHVTDVWQTGVRPVFRVTLANGYAITMTKDHRCLTERGWMTLAQATGLRLNAGGGVTWNGASPAFAVNGVPAYQSREWLAEQRRQGQDVPAIAAAAGTSYHTIRKYLRRFGLQFSAQERARWSGIAQRGQRRTFEIDAGEPLGDFWARHAQWLPRHPDKRRPSPVRLVRTWSRIARIEYAGMQPTYDLEVAGPFHNFVANGLIVHNSVNEYSARYSILDREFYVPAIGDLCVQSAGNRQGRGASLSPDRAQRVLEMLRADAVRCYEHYQDMLNVDDAGNPIRPNDPGLARELSRMNLTLNYYTQWYWKIDLYNLFHFLSLRMDPHAQLEIRVYADAIAGVVRRWVPHAWEAFSDFRLHGVYLSRAERAALSELIAGKQPDLGALGMSKREQDEFWEKLKRP